MHALKKLRNMIEDENFNNDGQHVGPRTPVLSEKEAEKEEDDRPWLDSRLLGFQMEDLFKSEAPVMVLRLSTRSTNGLSTAGIASIQQLAGYCPRDLLKIRYFGEKCLREVQQRLRKHYCAQREG
jgi:DNA-directed RNA polymerase alpha subunit